ncbi:MAG: transposase, partial [Sulfurovum sp.]|nr:transposase [Sulfurovum sp.]
MESENHRYHVLVADDHDIVCAGVKSLLKNEHLTKEEEHYIVADSAYMSKANKRSYRDKGIINGIVQRRVRGQATLRAKQQQHNKHFASIRAIVELPFAFNKKLMGYT